MFAFFLRTIIELSAGCRPPIDGIARIRTGSAGVLACRPSKVADREFLTDVNISAQAETVVLLIWRRRKPDSLLNPALNPKTKSLIRAISVLLLPNGVPALSDRQSA
jgi:hypothetical protein